MQQGQHLALHQCAVAHGMFGLDENLHRPVPVEHQPDKIIKSEQSGTARGAIGPPTAMPSAPIELLQLGQRHIADQTCSCRGAVNPSIVHADEMTIEGQPNVALNSIGAFLKSELVGGQGVFGTIRRRTAMGHHEGTVLSVRCGGRRHGPTLPVPGLWIRPSILVRRLRIRCRHH